MPAPGSKKIPGCDPWVRQIFWEHKRRYGARRIAAELAAWGETCGPRRASRLLKQLGLQAIQPRSFRPRTTQSRHPLGYSPNLLVEAQPPSGINQVWLGDITFIPLTGARFAHLALLMDLYSRRIVGWELDEQMTEALVLAALREAIRQRQPSPGLIHHSDRGGQYAGGEYRQVLRRARMEQSMSRPDNCYDNAFLESCFGKLKTELPLEVYGDARRPRGGPRIRVLLRYEAAPFVLELPDSVRVRALPRMKNP